MCGKRPEYSIKFKFSYIIDISFKLNCLAIVTNIDTYIRTSFLDYKTLSVIIISWPHSDCNSNFVRSLNHCNDINFSIKTLSVHNQYILLLCRNGNVKF